MKSLLMPIRTKSQDCLLVMFDQVRAQRPEIYQGDEWQTWLCAIGDCISALPTQPQRWAATILVANDLVMAIPGTSLPIAHLAIQDAVFRAGVKL